MRLSYKYRIYPNQKQIEKLEEVFGFCRFLYNKALEERIDFYRKTGKSLSYNSQAAELPPIKEIYQDQTDSIYSQTLQSTLKQLDSAYKGFFRRVKAGSGKAGFPRFKNKDRFRSILFPQSNLNGFGIKQLANSNVKIYGIPGEISVEFHRPIEGVCKNVRLVKQANNYYLVASCDNVPLNILPKTDKTIAIDMGISNFITTDDGTSFHHPRPYKTAKEKLAYFSRKLALKQRDSNNRYKVKKLLAKTYEHTVNIRNDFQHKLANELIKENDTIIIEKLNVKGMLESKGFEVNKGNIQDASWSSFAAKLSYKAERAGRKLIEVNPANTSKMCSKCGNIKEHMTLVDRTYHCEACGFDANRDHNAALNIKKLGMSYAAGISPASEAPPFRTG